MEVGFGLHSTFDVLFLWGISRIPEKKVIFDSDRI